MWIESKGPDLEQESLLDPATTALVLIDVQNDFCHPEGAFGKAGRTGFGQMPTMADGIKRLLATARDKGIFTVFVRAVYDEEVTSAALADNRRRLGLVNSLCLEGSWGAGWYGGVEPTERPGEVVITKHRFDAFHGTPLDLYLRSNGIRTLVMTGTATSGCVESTVRDGFFLDYRIVVVPDCVADSLQVKHDNSLYVMGQVFARMISADAVTDTWRGSNSTARAWTAAAKAERSARPPGRSALVLLNLQLGRPDLGDALPVAAQLLEAARKSGKHVFHVLGTARAEAESPARHGRPANGATVPAFDPIGREFVVEKFRASGFADTRLGQLLRTNEIEEIVLAGAGAFGDIDATIRDALDRDFRVTVVADAVGFAANDVGLSSAWPGLVERQGGAIKDAALVTLAWAN